MYVDWWPTGALPAVLKVLSVNVAVHVPKAFKVPSETDLRANWNEVALWAFQSLELRQSVLDSQLLIVASGASKDIISQA